MKLKKLRKDKNCLNCGHIVEEKFCPNCGQENIETRQTFYFLLTHFIEDITHYDGKLWKTIKYLLSYPGKLTKEYLAGKRQLFVAPVRLYIFISFITFLLIAFNASSEMENESKSETAHQTQITERKDSAELQKGETTGLNGTASINAKNMKQFDSIAKAEHNSFEYTLVRPFAKKLFELKEKRTPKREILHAFLTTFFSFASECAASLSSVFYVSIVGFSQKKEMVVF